MRHGRVLPHPAALQGLGGPHELQHNVSEESGERESKSCSHLSVCLSVSVSVSVSVSLGFCVSLSRMRPLASSLWHTLLRAPNPTYSSKISIRLRGTEVKVDGPGDAGEPYRPDSFVKLFTSLIATEWPDYTRAPCTPDSYHGGRSGLCSTTRKLFELCIRRCRPASLTQMTMQRRPCICGYCMCNPGDDA